MSNTKTHDDEFEHKGRKQITKVKNMSDVKYNQSFIFLQIVYAWTLLLNRRVYLFQLRIFYVVTASALESYQLLWSIFLEKGNTDFAIYSASDLDLAWMLLGLEHGTTSGHKQLLYEDLSMFF